MNLLLMVCLAGLLLITGCRHKSTSTTENAASLDELNRALSVVAMHSGTFPPPTSELTKFLALNGKTMPVPPPDKKLVIDLEKRQFILADQ